MIFELNVHCIADRRSGKARSPDASVCRAFSLIRRLRHCQRNEAVRKPAAFCWIASTLAPRNEGFRRPDGRSASIALTEQLFQSAFRHLLLTKVRPSEQNVDAGQIRDDSLCARDDRHDRRDERPGIILPPNFFSAKPLESPKTTKERFGEICKSRPISCGAPLKREGFLEHSL